MLAGDPEEGCLPLAPKRQEQRASQTRCVDGGDLPDTRALGAQRCGGFTPNQRAGVRSVCLAGGGAEVSGDAEAERRTSNEQPQAPGLRHLALILLNLVGAGERDTMGTLALVSSLPASPFWPGSPWEQPPLFEGL